MTEATQVQKYCAGGTRIKTLKPEDCNILLTIEGVIKVLTVMLKVKYLLLCGRLYNTVPILEIYIEFNDD